MDRLIPSMHGHGIGILTMDLDLMIWSEDVGGKMLLAARMLEVFVWKREEIWESLRS